MLSTPLRISLLALALAACGTTSTAPDAAAPPRDATPDVAPDKLEEEDVPPCAVRPDASNVSCVMRVRGRAVDLTGAPFGNGVITYCGAICFATNADAMGNFSLDVGTFIDPSVYSLLVHGRPDHGSLYVASPAPVDGVVTLAEPVAVPRYQDMGPMLPSTTAGGTFTAGDVMLTVAPGTALEFDVEDALLGALGQQMRAVYVPMAQAPRFARDAGLAAVWALAPFNLLADRPMAVRVANRTGLAPNTAVEFVVLGQEIVRAPPTAGQAIVAATGRVSADGMFVTTDPGTGISFVTWLGIRPQR